MSIVIIMAGLLYLFHVGDSAIYIRESRPDQSVIGINYITKFHNTRNFSEIERLKSKNCYISPEGYIYNRINVSRAMGDFDGLPRTLTGSVGIDVFKSCIRPMPEVRIFDIRKDFNYDIIMASDGLWGIKEERYWPIDAPHLLQITDWNKTIMRSSQITYDNTTVIKIKITSTDNLKENRSTIKSISNGSPEIRRYS